MAQTAAVIAAHHDQSDVVDYIVDHHGLNLCEAGDSAVCTVCLAIGDARSDPFLGSGLFCEAHRRIYPLSLLHVIVMSRKSALAVHVLEKYGLAPDPVRTSLFLWPGGKGMW